MRKINKPCVTIVVVNWNGIFYLKKTIPSLLKIKYPNLEIIVVDNGSTDESISFLRKYKKISIINNPITRSKNYGANLGISKAKGEFILLLDNDALIEDEEIIFDLIALHATQEKIGVIGLSFVDEGQNTSKSYGNPMGFYYIKESKSIPLTDIQKMNGKYIAFPEGKGLFIKRDTWIKIGGYDDLIPFGGDDSDLGIRLWIYGYKNILYSKNIQTHIGQSERKDNKKYALKLQDMIVGHLSSIIKNFSFINMCLTLVGFSIFAFLKVMKQAINRKYPRVVFSFFFAHLIFLKNLKKLLKKRSQIQSRRVTSDIFLTI